jgi:hypothetical protein
MSRRYSADRYRSSSRFPPAHVLRVPSRAFLAELGEVRVAGPSGLGQPARDRRAHLFNPSIVRAPAGLCPRCAFIASARADVLHQCDATTPLNGEPGLPRVVATNGFFKGSILAVLDDELHPLGWTWLLNAPDQQVSPIASSGTSTSPGSSSRSGFWAPRGASGAFPPPWSAHSIDARLFDLEGDGASGRLFVTVLRSCHAHQPCHFALSQLQLTARPTADGGLTELRAWAYPSVASDEPWAQGRNQALFSMAVGGDTSSAGSSGREGASGGRRELLVQPWLGVVASWGVPHFRRLRLRCSPWAAPAAGRRVVPRWVRKQHRIVCGTTPPGTVLHTEVLAPPSNGVGGAAAAAALTDTSQLPERPLGALKLLHNHSLLLSAAMSTAAGRRSLTTNLIRIDRSGGHGQRCAALLGVGHLHHSDGGRSGQTRPATPGRPATPSARGHSDATPFAFGADYDHFWFTVAPRHPFEPLAVSRDFCIASADGPADCERVQFVSGMLAVRDATAPNTSSWMWPGGSRARPDRSGSSHGRAAQGKPPHPRSLLLSYGVNDCEARVARIPLERVWRMLRPLPGVAEPCVPAAAGRGSAR